MAAKVRRSTVIRSEGGYWSNKDEAVRDVVAALASELESGLKATRLTVETKLGRDSNSVKVEAKLSMESQ